MIRLVVIALLAACTLRVEVDIRSTPSQARPVAYTAPEQRDAGAGLAIGGGATGSLGGNVLTINDIDQDTYCESPNEIPAVSCGNGVMHYDGCSWACEAWQQVLPPHHCNDYFKDEVWTPSGCRRAKSVRDGRLD